MMIMIMKKQRHTGQVRKIDACQRSMFSSLAAKYDCFDGYTTNHTKYFISGEKAAMEQVIATIEECYTPYVIVAQQEG